MRAQLAALVAVVGLAACGAGPDSEAGTSSFPVTSGGGGSPSPAPTPPSPPPPPPPPSPSGSAEGFWTGSTSTGFYFAALITAAGDIWALYGSAAGVAYGAIKGTTAGSGNGRVQASGTDYYLAGGQIFAVSMQGSVTQRSSMSGSYSGGNPGSFTATYDTRYDAPAQLSDLAGTWRVDTASTAGNVRTTVTVDGAGNIAASSPLCTVTGTATPAPAGKGYFTTSTTFDGSRCPWSGLTLQGVAVRAVIAGGERLTLASVSADGATGFVATGTR